MIEAPNRYWVIQKGNTLVEKIETTANNPKEIEYTIPDNCIAVSVSSRSELINQTRDISVLTAEEKRVLGIPPEQSNE